MIEHKYLPKKIEDKCKKGLAILCLHHLCTPNVHHLDLTNEEENIFLVSLTLDFSSLVTSGWCASRVHKWCTHNISLSHIKRGCDYLDSNGNRCYLWGEREFPFCSFVDIEVRGVTRPPTDTPPSRPHSPFPQLPFPPLPSRAN